MKRERVAPRSDWIERLEALEFSIWRHPNGKPYWREDACFVLSEAEVEELHAAAEACVVMVDAAVSRAFDEDYISLLGVHGVLADAARASWRRKAPTLYGRFDFAWDGASPPKLLEYNADTPTALYEAAVVQWRWLIDRDPDADQYNSIHEQLIAAWAALRPTLGPSVHFACLLDAPDDVLTTAYLRDIAVQAGFAARLLDVADIGWTGSAFVDDADAPIDALFKLYPWEWMAAEPFGPQFADGAHHVIEPAWRSVASSKALLADLWDMNRGHPNLLAASLDPRASLGDAVAKAFFGREGAEVRARRGRPAVEPGTVYQHRAAMPRFDGGYPVFGVWVVGGAPCGLGIREDANPITGPDACFIPHRIG